MPCCALSDDGGGATNRPPLNQPTRTHKLCTAHTPSTTLHQHQHHQAALKRILSDSEEAIAADVAPLLKTVVATNRFEKEMAALFASPNGSGGSGGGAGGNGSGAEAGGGGEAGADGELRDIDGLPASEARRRLEAFRRRQQAAQAAAAAGDGGAAGAGGAPEPDGGDVAAAAARGAFEGAISEAFEGALKFYVAEEQREVGRGGCGGGGGVEEGGERVMERGRERGREWCTLIYHTHTPCQQHKTPTVKTKKRQTTRQLLRYCEQLARAEDARRWLPPDDAAAAGGVRVLASAPALFLKVRASLNRCVRLVSRGQTLVGLAGAFKVRGGGREGGEGEGGK